MSGVDMAGWVRRAVLENPTVPDDTLARRLGVQAFQIRAIRATA